MEIILKSEVRNLGEKDDVVKVRDGYALNFLIPQGLAIPATVTAKKVHSENMKQASHKFAKIKDEAQTTAEKLQSLRLQITALVGSQGKLYGSITPIQIANQLKEMGIEVDRRRITIPVEIKTMGTFKVGINLHKEVKIEIEVEVIEKATEA